MYCSAMITRLLVGRLTPAIRATISLLQSAAIVPPILFLKSYSEGPQRVKTTPFPASGARHRLVVLQLNAGYVRTHRRFVNLRARPERRFWAVFRGNFRP